MKDEALTKAVLKFQRTGEGKKETIDAIALRVYRIAHLKDDWDQDDAGDFFCTFLPKIPILMEQYRDTGSSFEVYLHVHLLWSIKGFAKKLKTRRYEETLTTYHTFWEVHENPCEESLSSPNVPERLQAVYKISREGELTSTMWKQRFIFLILREAEYLDHYYIEHIVNATGFNRKWLLNCIVSLKERMNKRKQRLETFRRKRNHWFYRYYLLQLRLSDTYDPEKRKNILRQLSLSHDRFVRAADRVIRMHAHPTNQDIAEVLNVPKGSVDSGIYYVLNKYRKIENAAEVGDEAEEELPEAA
ncbi:MAG: hypothetical protein R6V67_05275 [Spirochaetia bacterium]